MVRPQVKICCIRSRAEARLAVAEGAAALGLVSYMPSGPGVIPEARITAIAATVPPPVATFLLTSATDPTLIAAQVGRCGTSTVQLCAPMKAEQHAELRRRLSGVKIVQVVHVTGEEAVATANAVASSVDAILLDSGTPTGSRPRLGGTGQIHDWQVSRRIRQEVAKPIFLAGGLRPDNVAEAIAQVAPFGVDVCTGVRTDDRLDPAKLRRFMMAVRSAVSPA